MDFKVFEGHVKALRLPQVVKAAARAAVTAGCLGAYAAGAGTSELRATRAAAPTGTASGDAWGRIALECHEDVVEMGKIIDKCK